MTRALRGPRRRWLGLFLLLALVAGPGAPGDAAPLPQALSDIVAARMDRDGVPGALMGCDKQGNGDWTDPGDIVDPAFDQNHDAQGQPAPDGRPDTGILDPGATFSFVAEIVPSNKHNKRIEHTRFTAISSFDSLVTSSVRDETASLAT